MNIKSIICEKAVRGVVMLTLSGMVLFNISCERENTDPPEIYRVRAIDPEQASVDLDGAGLNQWIVVEGMNLATTQHIYFNDFEAGFNPVYVTETNIVVQIPAETPNIGTDPDAPNTLLVVTEYGEDSISFITFAPPAEIYGMSCEYALPGDTLMLVGQYFFGVDSVIFPTDLSAEVLGSSEDGLYCWVVVPEGATETGSISVFTKGGEGSTMDGLYFRDDANVFVNFDDKNPWLSWGGSVISSASASLPVISGNYFRALIENAIGTWWVDASAMPLNIGPLPSLGSSIPADQIFFKFEMNADGIWNAGRYVLLFVEREVGDADGDGTAEEWLNEMRYELQPWNLEEGRIEYTTNGKWITVIIPFSEFTDDGENITEYGDLSAINYMQNVFINPEGPDQGGQEVVHLELGFDNFRIWHPN